MQWAFVAVEKREEKSVPKVNLITKEQWDKMAAFSKGYAAYWTGGLPGSELKNVTNPYKYGTDEHEQYERGEREATQDAQDSEE